MKLRISHNFSLPAEAVTETFAILAKRGVGKTYTAKKIAEQMLKAGIAPVVVADPVGVWWGLRSSADGKGPGLPILVLGGDYADAPLEASAGELVARMLVEERLSAVLDLSRFRKNEQTQFMTAFAERLYHDNREALHLMLDEADAFAPQKPYKGQERLLGAIEDLVRRGRARGIGVTLITQRAAVINKDVLTQAEVLVALRTIAPQDRAAIEAWIRVHGTEDQGDELMKSLPSLPIGTAWFWSPGWLDVFQRVEVERVETFDSSATPKAGHAAKKPRALAPVDIAAVKARLQATIERAKAEDPKLLRAEIARLQAELKKAQSKVAPVAQPDPAVFERALTAGIQKVTRKLSNEAAVMIGRARKAMESAVQTLQTGLPPAELKFKELVDLPATLPASAVPIRGPAAPAIEQTRRALPPAKAETSETVNLGGAQRVLKALAQRHPLQVTRRQLATLAGLAPTGGTFGTYFSRLKTAGYIGESNGYVAVTAEGLGAADVMPQQPQTTEELVAMWRANVGGGAARMLDILVALEGGWITRNELADRLEMAAGGGSFGTYLSRLRSNGLAETQGSQVRASSSLFDPGSQVLPAGSGG